jgi:hypothetical protein
VLVLLSRILARAAVCELKSQDKEEKRPAKGMSKKM